MCGKMLGCVLEPHGSLCKCVLFCLVGLLVLVFFGFFGFF